MCHIYGPIWRGQKRVRSDARPREAPIRECPDGVDPADPAG